MQMKIYEEQKNYFEKANYIIEKADCYLFIFMITLSVLFNLIHLILIHS